MAGILYRAGLTRTECGVRLRVKAVDFGYSQITVRDGKGEKDRVAILPALLPANLLAHLERVKAVPMTSERYRSRWGHRDGSTTMVYTHLLNRGGRGVRSPLDGAGV